MLNSSLLIEAILAFAGGALSLLAPCGALLLPGFFSYAFGTRGRTLLSMAGYYYLGLIALFVPLGLGLTYLLRLAILQRGPLFLGIGVVIVLLGLFTMLRPLSLPGLRLSQQGPPKTDAVSMFVLGVTSGLTTGTCAAPILGGILTLAAGSRTYGTAALLLLIYAAGIVAALLVFAWFFQRLARPFTRWWSGWMLHLRFHGRDITVPGQQIIRGLFVALVGVLFTLTQGSFGLEDVYTRLGMTTLAYQLNVNLIDWAQQAVPYLASLALMGGALFVMRRMCLKRQCAIQNRPVNNQINSPVNNTVNSPVNGQVGAQKDGQ